MQFAVETNSSSIPVYTLTLRADVVPEIEVVPLNVDDPVVVDREAVVRTIRITTRRLGDDGRDAPLAVEASRPIAVEFIGAGRELKLSGGIIESTRDVKVTYPRTADPGPQNGELIFRWRNNLSHRHALRWNVSPELTVTPAGLLVKEGEGRSRRLIRIVSGSEGFRITGISGEVVVGTFKPRSAGDSREQSVEIEVDPSRAASKSTSMIRMRTNHPRQPQIELLTIIVPK